MTNNTSEVVAAILKAGDLLIGIGILNEFLDSHGVLDRVIEQSEMDQALANGDNETLHDFIRRS